MNAGFRAYGPRESDISKMIVFENGNDFARVFVKDGMHHNPRTGEVMSMVELALMLHWGADRIPSRPFMSDFMNEHTDDCMAILRKNMRIVSSKTELGKGKMRIRILFKNVGQEIAELLKRFMVTYYKAVTPNAPLTIRLKGSDIPLLDTGQLVSAISSKYMHGGSV